jgi:hypothetical protein
MEIPLSVFVEETLVGVFAGVTAAVGRGVKITTLTRPQPATVASGHSQFQRVEFDIAVTVTSEQKKGSRAGMCISVVTSFIGGDAREETVKEDQRITRLRFAIPVRISGSEIENPVHRSFPPTA